MIGGYTSEALSLTFANIGFVLPLIGVVVAAFALAPFVVLKGRNLSHLIRTGTLASRGGMRLRWALVVVQIALGLVLIRGTGLLARSFDALMSVDPGFEADGLLTFGLGLPEGRYDTEQKMLAFHRSLTGQLEAIPGVEAAGGGVWLPLFGPGYRAAFLPEGEGAPRNEWPSAGVRLLTPGALETLHIPLIEGRAFTWWDDLDAPRVLLVNQAFGRVHFRDRSPIGERVAVSWRSPSNPEGTIWEIVGVIGDTRPRLEEEPVPEIAFPVGQFPPEGISYLIRSARSDPDLAASIRASVNAIDADLQQIRIRTMHELIAESVSDRRLSLELTSALSATALALAAMGVFGVLAFMVSRRRRELAIRLALGATRHHLRSLVLGECAKLTLAGVTVSLLGFAYVGALVQSQLYGVEACDTKTLVASVGTLLVVAFLAAVAPSQRATRTEPMETLREE